MKEIQSFSHLHKLLVELWLASGVLDFVFILMLLSCAMIPLNPSFPPRHDLTPIRASSFFGSLSLLMKALVLFFTSPSQLLKIIFQGSSFGGIPSGEGEIKPFYWFRSVINIMVG